MTSTAETTDDYYLKVIKPGDEASEKYKKACIEANKHSYIGKLGILRGGKIVLNTDGFFNRNIELENQIDGVGTKTRIYMKQFEYFYREYLKEKTEETFERLLDNTSELMDRMLHDFFAMNADDLRDGEMALAMTNIMDVNHLDGERGQIFGEAMARAMSSIIKETGIAIMNGETAILGESMICKEVIGLTRSRIEELNIDLSSCEKSLSHIDLSKVEDRALSDLITKILEKTRDMKKKTDSVVVGINNITEQIDVNLGGSVIGMKLENKLVSLNDGQVVIGFQEKPTATGIIGPRSNGISKIRDIMEDLLGVDWPNMTMRHFICAMKKRHGRIPEGRLQQLKKLVTELGLDANLGDIATGKTTIFNPFISKKLLGGIDDVSRFPISKIIHVTGNPVKKIASAVGMSEFDINLDISLMSIPQIITMCQIASGMSDEEAMNKWNMGVPCAIVCNKFDTRTIIAKAEKAGFIAKVIGTINKSEAEPTLKIKGIGGSDQTRTYLINEALR